MVLTVNELIERYLTLKRLPRTGWIQRGVNNPETIASHCWGVSFLTILIADHLKKRGLDINTEKCLKMAIIHDFHEAVIGDIPTPALDPNTKKMIEKNAIEHTIDVPEYRELSIEYIEGSSLEAKIVRLADLLDMVLQAGDYASDGFSRVREFSRLIETIRKHPLYEGVKDLIEKILSTRW